MIKIFKDDDEGYFDFVKNHPKAFVFNYFQRSSTEYNKIHKAECQWLPTPGCGKKATTVRKVVSDDYFELINWLKEGFRGMFLNKDYSLCQFCSPHPSSSTFNIQTKPKEDKMIEKYNELNKRSRDFIRNWDGMVSEDNLDDFIKEAVKLDKFRFETSYEWYEPVTYKHTKKYIFENPNPDKGLLLFFLCCWLDLQMDYRIIWSRLLEEASYWIDDPERYEIPRGSYPATAPNLVKTLNVANSFGNISSWFIETILNIAKENYKNKGNLYRFVGHIMSNLLEPSKYLSSTISYLKQGNVDLLGNWKRLWTVSYTHLTLPTIYSV